MATKREREENDSEEVSSSDIDVSSSDEEEMKLEGEESDDDEDADVVNVDFEFFNLNPDVDFHATKNFLRQLFQDDSQLFPLSALADLVLKLGNIGTTIKTDGLKSDPFAMLSVINLSENKENKDVTPLIDYFLAKTKSQPKLQLQLNKILSMSSKSNVGMIFSQRLINMPVQTMPPVYKMFLDETKGEFDFDYYIIPSRVNQILASKVDKEFEDDEETESARKRAKKSSSEPEYEHVHYEDEVLEKHALQKGYFEYTHKNVDADGRRVFNDYAVDPKLSVMLLDKKQFAAAVKEMEKEFPYM